jgi:hypothetical protein
VKMNQPYSGVSQVCWMFQMCCAYHQIETEDIVKSSTLVSANDFEATGSEDDGSADPETTVRRKSSGTESVSDSHFPER